MKRYLWILLASLVLLAGCKGAGEEEGDGPFLYYVNTDGTDLVRQEAKSLEGDPKEAVSYLLDALQEKTDTIDYKSAFPQKVTVEDWTLEEGRLKLFFTQDYEDMDQAAEVLLKAAVVQTLTQVEGVDSVEFFVGDKPLARKDGTAVGPMTAEEFIQNTGSSLHSYQVGNFSLYFAGKEGKLVREAVEVRYNSNISAEKQIIEQLIKGPSGENALPTLPEDTKLLGVSVRDGVCYVNFSEEFLQPVDQVDPKLTIYSIVNSITASGSAGKVQILVNGETNLSYQETIDISQPFSMNADLIEEEE